VINIGPVKNCACRPKVMGLLMNRHACFVALVLSNVVNLVN